MEDTTDLTAKTILFAWELGANLGHVRPLTALARSLAARGAKPVFAVRDLGYARLAAENDGFTILQSPVWPDHRNWGHRPAVSSYSDVLSGIGFADPQKLGAVMTAWSAIVDLIKPDLVVCDHSPGLTAALYGTPTPLIAAGIPFAMPPLSLDRLPPLRPDQAPLLPEARLLQSLRQAVIANGRRPPASMVDFLRSDERLVFGLPELDPYHPFRNEEILSPPEPMPAFVVPPVKPRLFFYAGADVPHIETVVQSLAQMDVEIVAYLRGDVGPLPHFLKHRGHTVYDTPPPLNEILPTVSHVMSQGGAGMCNAAIRAGRPHLIMPLHNETELNFEMCRKLRVARRLDPSKDDKAMRAAIDSFLSAPILIQEARHWALTVAMRPQRNGSDELIAAVARCFARRDQMRSSRLRSAAAFAHPS